MATLHLQEKEMLSEKVEDFPVLHDKRVKVFKENYAVQNTWDKVAESLGVAENGNFVGSSRN